MGTALHWRPPGQVLLNDQLTSDGCERELTDDVLEPVLQCVVVVQSSVAVLDVPSKPQIDAAAAVEELPYNHPLVVGFCVKN